MINRERGEQRLVVGAQAFVLRLTVNAACAVEELSGRRLDVLAREMSLGSGRDTRWFLWAALQDHHPEITPTLDAVGMLIDQGGGLAVLQPQLITFAKLNEPPAQPGRATTKASATEEPLNWQRLYIQMRSAGLAPEAFWALSLRELWAEVRVLRKHRRQEVERAYLIEYMARQKVLRGGLIEKLAPETERPNTQTPKQQLAMMQALAAQLGTSLVRIPWSKP